MGIKEGPFSILGNIPTKNLIGFDIIMFFMHFHSGLFHKYHNTTGEWDAVWIDGSDLKEEGVWKLSSGQPISTSLIWFQGKLYFPHASFISI